MIEQLRVPVPYRSPKTLHPSTSHAMRLDVERVADGYTLGVELWLVGVPRSRETHRATARTVSECIDGIAAQVGVPAGDGRHDLLRGPAVSKLVDGAIRRALLEGHGRTADSGSIAARRKEEPGRILVVDSNAPVRELLLVLLDVAGFQVVGAADLRAAMQACEATRFDAAVVDVDAGNGESLRILDWFRACRPPIAVVTVGAGVAHAGGDFAGATYLQKPFTRRELVEAIRKELVPEPPA